MLYYTIGIDEKTWKMLEKICEVKKLTPDQLIKQGIEKVVKKEIYQENKLISRLFYFYTKAGIRNRKQIFGTGKFPESEIEYDALDRRTREKYFNAEGELDDSNGFAIKEYLYDKSGEKVGETIYNSDGEIINH